MISHIVSSFVDMSVLAISDARFGFAVYAYVRVWATVCNYVLMWVCVWVDVSVCTQNSLRLSQFSWCEIDFCIFAH